MIIPQSSNSSRSWLVATAASEFQPSNFWNAEEKTIGRNFWNKCRGECVINQACEDVIVNRLELRCIHSSPTSLRAGSQEWRKHCTNLSCLPQRHRYLSERLCFPLEHCLRRLRTAVTGYFPTEENIVFDLVSMSIWWLFLKRTSTEKDQCSSQGWIKTGKEPLLALAVLVSGTSPLTTHPAGSLVLLGLQWKIPAGLNHLDYIIKFIFWVNLHFMHSSSNSTFLIFDSTTIVGGHGIRDRMMMGREHE